MCPQLLLHRLSYATNSRSEPTDMSGMQYPDILRRGEVLHFNGFDVSARDGGLKYLWHHQPQSHTV
jgi:hypothetical protein